MLHLVRVINLHIIIIIIIINENVLSVYLSVCLILCSLCTATVLSGFGLNVARCIVIISGWSWRLVSAARAHGLALHAPFIAANDRVASFIGKFGISGSSAVGARYKR